MKNITEIIVRLTGWADGNDDTSDTCENPVEREYHIGRADGYRQALRIVQGEAALAARGNVRPKAVNNRLTDQTGKFRKAAAIAHTEADKSYYTGRADAYEHTLTLIEEQEQA